MTHEQFFGLPYDKRCRWAWWRWLDPFAMWSWLLDVLQQVANRINIDFAQAVYDARLSLRERFEADVIAIAHREIMATVENWLTPWRGLYFLAPGIEARLYHDLVRALIQDKEVSQRAADLQWMRESRKSLFYRTWNLWDGLSKNTNLVLDRVRAEGDEYLTESLIRVVADFRGEHGDVDETFYRSLRLSLIHALCEDSALLEALDDVKDNAPEARASIVAEAVDWHLPLVSVDVFSLLPDHLDLPAGFVTTEEI